MNDVDVGDRPRTEEQAKRLPVKNYKKHPNKAWDVIVDVYLNSTGPGPNDAAFDILTCLPVVVSGTNPNPQIQFNNEGRPGFNITFRLFDNTNGGNGSNFQFASNPDDAVWSQLGSTCPTGPVWDVFPNNRTKVKDDTTVVVFNPNEEGCLGPFQYTLNVSVDGNPPYLPLDPGGNNMNGGSGRWR